MIDNIDNLSADLSQLSKTSYTSIYYLRDAFRRAGGTNDIYSDKFNATDSPVTVYFRILFNFRNGRLLDLTHNTTSLLQSAHSKDDYKGEGERADDTRWKDYSIYDTAFNYLLLNNEFERADMIKQFVQLLSNINTYSPWYFQSISGLDQVLIRPELGGNEFKVAEEVKLLTIKCLPDAYDNRIGTLLDLYRAACFSQRLHKEIVPSNLRKFDMSIYLLSTPIRNMHTHTPLGPAEFEHPVNNKSYEKLSSLSSNSFTSTKLIEFQDCEFDLNSSASPYGELNNAEGNQLEYSIGIKVGQVYEQRYNEFLTRFIGDMVAWDVDHTIDSETERNNYTPDMDGEQTDDSKDIHTILGRNTEARATAYRNSEYEAKDDHEGINDNLLGTTATSELMRKYGLRDVQNKADSKVRDMRDKYSPSVNLQRAQDAATSLLSQAVNQGVSNIVFGNLFYDNDSLGGILNRGFKGIIEDTVSGIRGATNGINRTNPGSSVGANLYKGWTKSSK